MRLTLVDDPRDTIGLTQKDNSCYIDCVLQVAKVLGVAQMRYNYSVELYEDDLATDIKRFQQEFSQSKYRVYPVDVVTFSNKARLLLREAQQSIGSDQLNIERNALYREQARIVRKLYGAYQDTMLQQTALTFGLSSTSQTRRVVKACRYQEELSSLPINEGILFMPHRKYPKDATYTLGDLLEDFLQLVQLGSQENICAKCDQQKTKHNRV